MKDLFKRESKKILIYASKETVEDPYDKNSSHSILNSLPIDAIVFDIAGESMKWKTGGIITVDGKEIICKRRHKELIKMSYKIEVEGESYQGFTVNGHMQIRNLDSEYISLYIYRTK